MPEDMRADPDAADNWKIDELCKLLGDTGFRCLFRLWGYAARRRPHGSFDKMTAEEIEGAAGWKGAAGVFAAACVRYRLLDVDLLGYRIHDWAEHQPYVVTAPQRKAVAKAAAAARWKNKYKHDTGNTPETNRLDTSQTPAAHRPEPDLLNSNFQNGEKSCSMHADAPLPEPNPRLETGFKTGGTTAASPPVFDHPDVPRKLPAIKRAADYLPKFPEPRPPDPGRVDNTWELWQVAEHILLANGWKTAERAEAIKHIKRKSKGDFVLFRDQVAHVLYVTDQDLRGEVKRSKIASLIGCKKAPIKRWSDLAKVAIEGAQEWLDNQTALRAKPRQEPQERRETANVDGGG